MQVVELKANPRTINGTRGAKDERKKEMIPAVVYGGKTTHHVSIDPKELKSLIYTPEFKTAKLTMSDGSVNVFVKQIQFHPITDAVSHIDFMELVPGKAVTVEVPLKLDGYAAGVKAGGKLVQRVRKIKIKATPEKLVNEIKADVTNIQLGSVMRIREIAFPEGVASVSDTAIPIATVIIPRALKEEEKTAAAAPAAPAKSAATPAKAAAAPAPAAKK